jgi:hypothetical protein
MTDDEYEEVKPFILDTKSQQVEVSKRSPDLEEIVAAMERQRQEIRSLNAEAMRLYASGDFDRANALARKVQAIERGELQDDPLDKEKPEPSTITPGNFIESSKDPDAPTFPRQIKVTKETDFRSAMINQVEQLQERTRFNSLSARGNPAVYAAGYKAAVGDVLKLLRTPVYEASK